MGGMASLIRFGVSLPRELSLRFDEWMRERRHTNRSESLRSLIREALVREEWTTGGPVAGALTLVYDHHRRDLVARLTEIQHDHQDVIVSAQHIHLDHHHCLEIVAVKGNARKVKALADRLKGARGVKHLALTMSSTGRSLG
jgi:CopG family nickel-responsive transcriptional regulator